MIEVMARDTNDKHMRGAIGSEVHFKKNRKYFARTRVDEMKPTKSEVLRESRMSFGGTVKFGRRSKYVIADSFPWRKPGESAFAAFTRVNRPYFEVTDLENEVVVPDYERLQFSEGGMMPPTGVTVTYSADPAMLTFEAGVGVMDQPGYAAMDRLRGVVVVAADGYMLAVKVELGTRGEGGSTQLRLDGTWTSDMLHAYVYALNADGTDASMTRYVAITGA